MNNTEEINKFKSSAWTFFIKRKPIAYLMILTITIFGILSAYEMPKELQPEINIPYATISTFLPGAGPLDMESLITEPIENAIAKIENLKTLSSTSGFGTSIIFMEFEANANVDTAIQKTKEQLDIIQNNLPEDASQPMVIKAEINSLPIINFTFAGEKSLNEITEIAEKTSKELEKINGIAEVNIFGAQKKIIKITPNQKKLENLGISINAISNIIKFSKTAIPIGIIEMDKLNYSIRMDAEYKNIDDIKNLPIIAINETVITLQDIAKVEETYNKQTTISKFSTHGSLPQEALSISIIKKNNANIIEVAEKSREKIQELKENDTIPKDIIVEASNDNSEFVKTDLGILTTNGIQTAIIITIILFLALGLKEGLLAGLAIPLSFLVAFTIMQLAGLTINSLSLFSLVIALGLMVDTAIIIMEGIYENIRLGKSPQESAILSLKTYRWPLITGTMTTVFAFFPMLLVGGIMGEFLKTLPITIAATLLGSLIVSLTIIPAIAARTLKSKKLNKKQSILEPFFDGLKKIFNRIISHIINKKILRISTILISILLFVLSVSLPASGLLKTELFPKTDVRYFMINIETPKGIILEETAKITKNIEEKLLGVKEIENFTTVVGQSANTYDLVNTGPNINSNIASITVNLVPEKERKRRSYEIAEDLRKQFQDFTLAKVSIREISEGPPSDSAITVRITGNNLDTLKEISNHIQKEIKSIKHTENINQSISAGLNEFVYELNREKIAIHGLSIPEISTLIRSIIQGAEVTEIKLNNEDLKILIEYDQKTTITELENIEIKTPKEYSINLSQIGKYELKESLSSIQRENQKRIIKVFSDVTKEGNAVEITTELENKLKNYNLPEGYDITFGGDMEEINNSFMELYKSMVVGIILIALCLVLMFNSFKQPFIILLALPLALIGVFPGLLLVNLNLSFPAFLGVVALAGIVVNDAIVLIDRININKNSGMEIKTAITEASTARLQPIIMTSITTIIGITPLALTNEFWSGLGFSLIFGLICSTLLTLIVIPVMYHIFEKSNSTQKQTLT